MAKATIQKFLERAYDAARRRGLRVEEYILPHGFDYGNGEWCAGDTWMVRLVRPATPLFPREFHVDIEIRHKRDDHVWWVILTDDMVYVCAAEEKMLRDGRREPFLGRSVTVPLKPEHYLTHLYGDWQRPDPEYDTADDGSIVIRRKRTASQL